MKKENGRYWNLPWSLVDGCTPCSPGCDHCWALAMEKRFRFRDYTEIDGEIGRRHDTSIQTRPERLDIPLKRKKPTVWAVWNDLFHEDVPSQFINQAWITIRNAPQHKYLILTKRPHKMLQWTLGAAASKAWPVDEIWSDSSYLGLTICNQQEADEKIPIFLRVPGKKFLSIEPMLGAIELSNYGTGASIDAVILGGETGSGARHLHQVWVRSTRDQCAAAGIPFFFKQWGAATKYYTTNRKVIKGYRILDGRTHDDLPWVKS